MNENHALCASPEWEERMQTEVLPRVAGSVDLGQSMLEIGPGPGATTDWLRHRVRSLLAVESDVEAVTRLQRRFADTNVDVVEGDATALELSDDSFDSAACFTMLHHVPTATLQNRLLSEVLRVLRPGGVLVGSDSLASPELHEFHEGDTYNPVEPAMLLVRLQTLGYERLTIAVDEDVRFVAHKPTP